MHDLPEFPWSTMIDMTAGDGDGRALGICLSAVHDAINTNTKVLMAILEELKQR